MHMTREAAGSEKALSRTRERVPEGRVRASYSPLDSSAA